MSNKITSGNWKIGNISSVVTDVRRNRPHTEIDEKSIIFYGGELICESIENENDARLIAAAPELLAACEFALSVQLHAGLYDVSDKLNAEKLQAAIAKAKGES